MNELSEIEYIGREFSEFGSHEVYTENGVYYFVPIMTFREISRLSRLDEKLTEPQRKELTNKLNEMHQKTKIILQN